MINGTLGVVVPAVGVERAHLHPPSTHLLCCVSKEATDVGTNVRDPKQVELHCTCRRESQVCSEHKNWLHSLTPDLHVGTITDTRPV